MKMKNRIDFVIAGVQKAGTTSLNASLRRHPGLCLSEKKELHFFDRPGFVASEEAYRSYHLEGWKREKFDETCLFGEATPKYGAVRKNSSVPYLHRIQTYNPDIRLIFVFRDPVERLFSQWWMLFRNGKTPESFSDFLGTRRGPTPEVLERHALARGDYGTLVKEAKRLFPTEQLKFLKFEDREAWLTDVWNFLGVDCQENVALEHWNEGKGKPGLDPDLAAELRRFYADEVCLFEELTGMDCTNWRES